MNHNTKVMAMVIVGVLVVATVIAAFALNSGKDSDARIHADDTALVYGNANHDYAIDDLDVQALQDIIDGNETWDKKENFLADANNDGDITEDDIKLVKKIINNEECKVFYLNHWDEAQEISYPQSNKKMAVTYWQQAEEVAILGCWDNVVAANASVMGKTNLYDLSHVKSFGESYGAGVDAAILETFFEEGVELVIASAYPSIKEALDPVKDKGIEAIYLWHNGKAMFPTILTLGILLDAEEQAEKYLKYRVDIEKKVEETIPPVNERPSLIITMMHGNEHDYYTGWGGIFTSVNHPNGEWDLLHMLANPYTAEPLGQPSQGRNFYSTEWFIQNPFDYQIVMASGVKITCQDDYDKWFEGTVDEWFDKTEQYKEGNICGVTFSLGGFSAYSLIPILAWMIYPDLFSLEDAEEVRQYYYDNFTDLKPDASTIYQYYQGDGFDASYLR